MSKSTPGRSFQVSAAEYPFADHWLPIRDGYIHYVGEGLRVHLPRGSHRNVTLLEVKEIGGGIVQLRYSLHP